jgi:hypothetical protein
MHGSGCKEQGSVHPCRIFPRFLHTPPHIPGECRVNPGPDRRRNLALDSDSGSAPESRHGSTQNCEMNFHDSAGTHELDVPPGDGVWSPTNRHARTG